MRIALCYESVLPAKGGAETYIGDLARRLDSDGHEVHLFACRWDTSTLPVTTHCHSIAKPGGPRFLRPWRFAEACERALAKTAHDVSIGFDKTWGQDILYPQGGLHAASRWHNQLKFGSRWGRLWGTIGKAINPASYSFARLERKQYLEHPESIVIVNSAMVRQHFQRFHNIPPERLRVIHSAIDPGRFQADDREMVRAAERKEWGIDNGVSVGLMVAMNYRLKGLAPLIRAVATLPANANQRFAIIGHPKTARYERLAKRLGVADRFLFLGFRANPRDAYFAADFLVHPTFYDPCSLVVLEALACGLPVLTSRYNGASERLDPPLNGLIIDDPHDAVEFGTALQRMLDPAYRRQAIPHVEQASREWTFEMHYQALLAVFAEVARRKVAGTLRVP